MTAAGYFAFVLLFELPLLPFYSSSSSPSSSLPIPHPHRRELEAAAAFASPFSPARPAKPAFPAAAPSPATSRAHQLPIFSSLLLLPRPNATATPFDATAADAFAAARPHLAHLQAPAPATSASSPPSSASPPAAPTCPASVSVHREQLPHDGVRVVELPCGLAVGSHVTVVARPRPARPEYDPKIAERKDGEAAVMVSRLMGSLHAPGGRGQGPGGPVGLLARFGEIRGAAAPLPVAIKDGSRPPAMGPVGVNGCFGEAKKVRPLVLEPLDVGVSGPSGEAANTKPPLGVGPVGVLGRSGAAKNANMFPALLASDPPGVVGAFSGNANMFPAAVVGWIDRSPGANENSARATRTRRDRGGCGSGVVDWVAHGAARPDADGTGRGRWWDGDGGE